MIIRTFQAKNDFNVFIVKIPKKMRKTLTIFLAGLMIIFFGCKKDVSKNDPGTTEEPLTWQQSINPSFDWSMWKDVNILLTNTQNKIFTITTVDGEGQYAKMLGIEDSYQMTIRMPKTTQQLSINGNIVNIQNGTVTYALPADYKSVATAQWALYFDHTAYDHVITGNPGITTYPFTMEAWFKTAGYDSDMAIMGYCSSANDEYQFGVYVNGSDGKLTIRSKKDTSNEEETGITVVTDDAWHHVAVVFASENSSKLFLDGTLEATETSFSPLLPTDVNLFTIGKWGDLNPDSYFEGFIDEVRLWNTARSASQINTYMTRSITSPYTGMAGYWPMEEGTGTTTDNLTGDTALDGTLVSPDWIGNVDTDGDGIVNISDDYPYDPLRAFNNYWPATAGTLAFEDLWPSMGDFDMNDAVIGYRFNRVTNSSNHLVEGIGNFDLKANGAGLKAGFGFSLPDNEVADNQFQISGYHLNQGIISLNGSNHSEAGQTYLTVIAHDYLPSRGNTLPGVYRGNYTFSVKISITGGDYGIDALGFQTWNPFIFVYNSSLINKRGHEIHLAGHIPSDMVQINLFDSANDGSSYPTGGISEDLWYKTNEKASMYGDSVGQYFPWGLDIPGNFSWTIEADSVNEPANGYYRHTIWWGYKKFKVWAGSNGLEAQDWYSGTGTAYRDEDFIYSH